MVLESIFNPLKAEKAPWNMFFIGALYSSAGLFLGNWIFKEYASLIMVFLTTMACIPLLYNTMRLEEKKDTAIEGEKNLLREHSKAILFLMFLFLGIMFSYVLWYVVLPSGFVQNSFKSQTLTIQSINVRIAGNVIQIRTLTNIMLNNLKVLIFCILFSFLYGAGAIFILTWNASVIAAATGNFIRTNLAAITAKTGVYKVASYFQIVSLALIRYMTHGIPEILAYFIGGLAGGIISVAVINEKFGTKRFEKIVLDSSDLILLAVLFLILAALIEVYITPILF
ncbi:stage II sporulation protein M [Candidatus Woesearchaeota archaeon]|nr:stage II sporulation protein M [Candidatus Woesearchaeota archaeon]